MTATTEPPTLLEELHALEVTVHRLATERDNAVAERADLLEANRRLQAERDAAMQMAGQATKDLVRARHQLVARDVVNKSRLAVIDGLNVENRRLDTRNHELAIENEDLRKQRDRDQQEPERAHRSWPSCLSRRIGNQL